MKARINLLLVFMVLAGCEPSNLPGDSGDSARRLKMVGKLEAGKLDEASGIQAGNDGVFFLHNDEGNRIFAIDGTGRDLGRMKIEGAKNKDWEDITRVMGDQGPMLVIGDTGDNLHTRKKVRLYFVNEPARGEYRDDLELVHRLKFRYEDGPRDVEAMAYDPASDMILLLSKRDQPPRLYGIPMDLALWEDELEATFLGEVPGFRPPTRSDILTSPKRGLWVSQPTGMDISADGRKAAVITYRSLYVFERQEQETWVEAFQRKPVEFAGPPGLHDEAVGFSHDQKSIFVTTERRPAPLWRLDYVGGEVVGIHQGSEGFFVDHFYSQAFRLAQLGACRFAGQHHGGFRRHAPGDPRAQ
jgi:hypothetical protein